ncbi:hypothetical protein JCM10207_004309 [Rhodosporidiobolus poonsookiae]
MTTVHPVTADDYVKVGQIERSAFAEPRDGIQALFRGVDPAVADAHNKKRFAFEASNPQKRLLKAVRDGETVGFAQWSVAWDPSKGEEMYEADYSQGPGWAEGTDVEQAEPFFASVVPQVKEPHFRLEVLVVDPAAQKTGAGRALLEWGIAEADKAGVDTYLESSEIALAFYPRFGFEAFREPIRGGRENQLVVYPMRRAAASTSSEA